MAGDDLPASWLKFLETVPERLEDRSPIPSYEPPPQYLPGFSLDSWATDIGGESFLSRSLAAVRRALGFNHPPGIPAARLPDDCPMDANLNRTNTEEGHRNRDGANPRDRSEMALSPQPRQSSPITIERSQPIEIPSARNQQLRLEKAAMEKMLACPDKGRIVRARVHHQNDRVQKYYRSRHVPQNFEAVEVYYDGAYQPLVVVNPWEEFHAQKVRNTEANIGKMETFNEPPISESLQEFQCLPAVKLNADEREIVVRQMRREKEVKIVPQRISPARNIRKQNMLDWAKLHPNDKDLVAGSGGFKHVIRNAEASRPR